MDEAYKNFTQTQKRPILGLSAIHLVGVDMRDIANSI